MLRLIQLERAPLAHRRGSPELLLIAAVAIAATDGYAIALWDKGPAITGLALATTLAAVAVLFRRSARDNPRVGQLILACGFCLFSYIQWHRTVALYGGGSLYTMAHDVAAALPLLGLVVLLGRRRVAEFAWAAMIIGFATAGIAVIMSSPRPVIDVWFFLQHAASCTPHACNPYTMTTPASPGVTQGIPYLPGSFLFLAPFRWVMGDVRYGLLLALVVAPLLLRRLMPGPSGLVAGSLLLTVPGTLFGLEESWIEPLLLVLILGTLLAWQRRQSELAIVILAAALLTKQHMFLLLPLVVFTMGWRKALAASGIAGLTALPWIIASPRAFYRDTVQYFLDLPGRLDALSVWMIAPKQVNAYLPIILVFAMYAIVWLLRPSSTEGFLLASGLVLAGFELTNKISFYNEWALPAMLLLSAATGTVLTGQCNGVDPSHRAERGQPLPRSELTCTSTAD